VQPDRRALALSTQSAEAAEHYRDATERFLLGRPGAVDEFGAAVTADPRCAEAHTALALARLFEGDLEGASGALALAAVHAKSERAMGFLVLVKALSEMDLATATTEGRMHLARYPHDELARETLGIMFFLLGRTEENMALYDWLAPDQGSDWSFAASWSFACHESGRLVQARQLGEQVLEEHPDDSFAVHSLAHVAYESGRHDEGLTLIDTFFDIAEPIAFHRRHLRWHGALHLLANGDAVGAQALWDTDIAPRAVAASLGAVDDGASLLWRWQLYDVGGWDLPWHELAPLAREIAAFPVTPLPAACAAVALAAIGDDEALGELVSSATKLAEAGLLVPAPLIAAVAEAARASFAGSWGHVADTLMPFADQFSAIGGSRAQREVFSDAILYSLVRANRGAEAVPLLEDRLERRPSVRERQLLARLG